MSDLDRMKALFDSLSIGYEIETKYDDHDYLAVEKDYALIEFEFTKEGKFEKHIGYTF